MILVIRLRCRGVPTGPSAKESGFTSVTVRRPAAPNENLAHVDEAAESDRR